jgi:hypothetical protein
MIFIPRALLKRNMKLFLISMIVLLGFNFSARAQCNNGISLIRVETTSSDLNEGSIEVNINSKGDYVAELFSVTGAGKISIQKKTGKGDQNMIFKELPANDTYQVLVIFNDEEQKFCKKRQISEISTLKK